YLALDPAEVDAAERLDARWRTARDELRTAGVPPELLERLDTALADHGGQAGSAIAMIAAAEGAPHVETLAPTVRNEHVTWAPLPVLQPIVVARQHAVPHVVVVVDRTGADLFGAV